MYFYMRLSALVEDKYGSTITSINTTTGEIVVDNIPSTFNNSSTLTSSTLLIMINYMILHKEKLLIN